MKLKRMIGAGRLSDMWAADRMYFVDGDNGNVSNTGLGYPEYALTLPSAAVNAANSAGYRDAVIYIRPRSTATGNQTYYIDNITIPIGLAGLSMIGAGSNPKRPYMGVDIKASASTSHVVNVKAPHVTLEGMRLAGTGQNATDAVAIVNAYNYGNSSGAPYGLTIRGCRLDNAKTGGAVRMDSPVGVLIEDCSFHDNVKGIYSTLSEMSGASFGPRVENCDFGGAVATRGVDIYVSQGGLGNTTGADSWLIVRCNFLDGLPNGGDNRFIKIANGDMGHIAFCSFPVDPGANMIDTFGAAGSQCILPTTWTMAGCYGSSDADPIHPILA
jgi:hypothetical protein